ncbi:glycosyltransferase [Salmonella enterica]|nr:glycosyltransferase [Salmonella enterica]EBP9775273.1 glycosyltransferase [Salmonella enterica]QWN88037.1 glycosyltransferase [Salmonella enterica]
MNILPIIVLYKCQLENSECINTLLRLDNVSHLKEIFVYNNSPSIISIPDQYMGINVHKINDHENSGVSKAYNEGLKFAKKMNYEYVLLLDQDTSLPGDALVIYKESLRANKYIKLFCPILKKNTGVICSPLLYRLHRGFPVNHFKAGKYEFDDFTPINSGMLLNVDAALECGGYNEEVFLDFSDFQFIERFKKHNPCFYVVPLILYQDCSGDEVDPSKLLIRFRLYCQCAKKCVREKIQDDFIYFLMVFARAVKMAVKTKRIDFIINFYKYYIRG